MFFWLFQNCILSFILSFWILISKIIDWYENDALGSVFSFRKYKKMYANMLPSTAMPKMERKEKYV